MDRLMSKVIDGNIEVGATYWNYIEADYHMAITEVISEKGCSNHFSGGTDIYENRHLLTSGMPSGLFINRHRWIKVYEPNGTPVDINGVAAQVEEQQPMYNYRNK